MSIYKVNSNSFTRVLLMCALYSNVKMFRQLNFDNSASNIAVIHL